MRPFLDELESLVVDDDLQSFSFVDVKVDAHGVGAIANTGKHGPRRAS